MKKVIDFQDLDKKPKSEVKKWCDEVIFEANTMIKQERNTFVQKSGFLLSEPVNVQGYSTFFDRYQNIIKSQIIFGQKVKCYQK
jgi:hypothetical protein